MAGLALLFLPLQVAHGTSEYDVTWESPTQLTDLEGAYQGTNPAQGFKSYFTELGNRTVPLLVDKPAWEVGLSLTAYGHAGALQPVGPGTHVVTGNRIDLARSGDLNEWYLNTADCLDQFLDLAAAPPGGEPDGATPLHFEFAVGGGLAAKVSADGRTVEFVRADGNALLRVSLPDILEAEDRLDARFETPLADTGEGPALRLIVDAREVTYPLGLNLQIAAVNPPETGASAGNDAPPANDDCSGAEVIPATGPFPYLTAVTADITDATATGDPPLPTCQTNVSRSIWYTFTPTVTTSYTIETCTPATNTTVADTVIAVYTSSTSACGGTYTQIAGGCNDDGCGLKSTLTVSLAAGTPYFILVHKYDTPAPSAGQTAVQLRVSQLPPPPPGPANDMCGGAEVIPGTGPFPYLTAVTDIASANSIGDPSPTCGSPPNSRGVWYEFTAASTATYRFTTCALQAPGTSITLDTVLAVFTSSNNLCSGTITQLAGGCNDDDTSCTDASPARRSTILVSMPAGAKVFLLVYEFGTGNTNPTKPVQIQVQEFLPPPNDACAGAIPVLLDVPVDGSTISAVNDLVPPAACFAAPGNNIGQITPAASGRDAIYSFTAPTTDSYSFKATGYSTSQNLVLYIGNAPCGSVCNAGSNRTTTASSEEVMCQPLTAGQQVFVYVDDGSATNFGSTFTLEVNRCVREAEPNGTPATANALSCPVEGTIAPAGDADFYALGTPAASSRVFALADGVAGNSTDFDMRVTTAADTLEYDDLNADIPFGSLAPVVAGTRTTGAATFLRMNHFSATTQAEPYRLYSTVQPPSGSATVETEPNGTIATANSSTIDYFLGDLPGPAPSTDVDFYRFTAAAQDLIFIGLDNDPDFDGTCTNTRLDLFNDAGTLLVGVNDGGSTSNLRSPVLATLTSTTPAACSEALTWRARVSGTYYARVQIGTTSTTGSGRGSYLLSIGNNCLAAASADLSVSKSDTPDPVATNSDITYTITVTNNGPSRAGLITLDDATPAGTTFRSVTPAAGWTCSAPPVGGTGNVSCTSGATPSLGVGESAVFTLVVRVDYCAGDGTIITNTATVSAATRDTNAGNNSAQTTTTVSDPGTCDDANACTQTDICVGNVCTGTNPVICTALDQCHDVGVCDTSTGICSNPEKPNGTACDDGDACTVNDTCQSGACTAGPPRDCNDGNVCTDDSCNPATGCVNTPNTAPCNDGSVCTTVDRCSGGVCVGSVPLNCDDGAVCTIDTCHPVNGCVNTEDPTCCTDNPKSQGYYKRLCAGPHPEDQITAADVNCVNNYCTFAPVNSIAELCERMTPNPHNDKCEQAEAQHMALLLNWCRGRVCASAAIDSACSDHTTVGQSIAHSDALLCNPGRTRNDCQHAQCEADEINSGEAQELNSVRGVRLSASSTRLTWQPPYANETSRPIKKYRIFRRPLGTGTWTQLAEVNSNILSYTDLTAGGGNFEYNVTPIR